MSDSTDNTHLLDYWRVIMSRKEIIISVLILVLISAAAITYMLPRVYQASTRIRIERDVIKDEVFDREMIMPYDPHFLPTQYEMIKSRKVMYEVMDNLDLVNRFQADIGYPPGSDPKQELYKLFLKRLRVQQYRDTNLIEISITLSIPEDDVRELCPAIVNEVARVFERQRRDYASEESRKITEDMYNEWVSEREKEKKVEEELEALRTELGIIEEDLGPVERIDPTDRDVLRAHTQAAIEAKIDLMTKSYAYSQIRDAEDEDLLHAAAYILRDPMLSTLRIERDTEEVQLEQLVKSFGEGHPRVAEQKTAIAVLETKIRNALEGLKVGLLADYEKAKLVHEEMERNLEEITANQVKQGAEKIRPWRQKKTELEKQRTITQQLESRYRTRKIQERISSSNIEIIDKAVIPHEGEFVSPNLMINLALAILIGLGSGIGLAYFIEYLDTSVKTIEDIERFIEAPVLGIIPQKVNPLIEEGPSSPHAEPYRVLRTNLKFHKDGGHALTITSGGVGEGKSLTLANLAYICATLGDRVLVIDSDMRRPRQHKILNVSNETGLADILFGELSVEDAIVETNIENLHFLPSGKPFGRVLRRSGSGAGRHPLRSHEEGIRLCLL